jgi:hypothetical protein
MASHALYHRTVYNYTIFFNFLYIPGITFYKKLYHDDTKPKYSYLEYTMYMTHMTHGVSLVYNWVIMISCLFRNE